MNYQMVGVTFQVYILFPVWQIPPILQDVKANVDTFTFGFYID